MAVAAMFRLVPVVPGAPLWRTLHTDSGTYFSISALVVRGDAVAYQDLWLLQPPGVYVLLAPFSWFGDPSTGVSAARIAFALLGVASTYLVGRIASRWVGPVAAGCGALVYAIFPMAVLTDVQLLTETPQHFVSLLVVAVWLGPERRWRIGDGRVILTGVLFGLSCWFRLPAALLIVALVAVAPDRRRWRDGASVVGVGVVTWMALCVPLAFRSLGGFVDQTILTQMARPHGLSAADGFDRVILMTGLPSASGLTGPATLATAVLVSALVIRLLGDGGREPSTMLGVVWMAMVLAFYLPTPLLRAIYVAGLAPGAALAAAGVAQWVGKAGSRPAAVRWLLAAGLITSALLSLRLTVILLRSDRPSVDPATVVAQAGPGCLTSLDPAWLLEGDRLPDPDVAGELSVEIFSPLVVASRDGFERSPGITGPGSVARLEELLDACPRVLTNAPTREALLAPLDQWFLDRFERVSEPSDNGPELWVRRTG